MEIKNLNNFLHKKRIIQLSHLAHQYDNASFETEIHLSIATYKKGIFVNQTLIGFILITNHHICNLVIHPNYQNQGYATQLLKQAMTDLNPLTLDVDPKNIKAISLYNKLGFKDTKKLDKKNYMVMEYKSS